MMNEDESSFGMDWVETLREGTEKVLVGVLQERAGEILTLGQLARMMPDYYPESSRSRKVPTTMAVQQYLRVIIAVSEGVLGEGNSPVQRVDLPEGHPERKGARKTGYMWVGEESRELT